MLPGESWLVTPLDSPKQLLQFSSLTPDRTGTFLAWHSLGRSVWNGNSGQTARIACLVRLHSISLDHHNLSQRVLRTSSSLACRTGLILQGMEKSYLFKEICSNSALKSFYTRDTFRGRSWKSDHQPHISVLSSSLERKNICSGIRLSDFMDAANFWVTASVARLTLFICFYFTWITIIAEHEWVRCSSITL